MLTSFPVDLASAKISADLVSGQPLWKEGLALRIFVLTQRTKVFNQPL